MESKNLIISETLESVNRKDLHKAYVVIIDNKVYKNRLALDNDTVLKYSQKDPQIVEAFIEQHIIKAKERFDRTMEEFAPIDLQHKNGIIDIQVSGITGSGKTNIALLIYDTLKSHGFDMNFQDEDLGFDDIQLMRNQRSEILSKIRDRQGIIIETNQKKR